MDTLWSALAIVCIIEGLGPLFMPNRWRLYLLAISQQPSNQLRQVGGVLVIVGAMSLFYLF
ncbi:DUF2065 domain-containing protein [Alteromonas sp. C1M14]|uniref:DUF2065 domain-containing protein n=1 Tax=Alteromonas sp. C1M14 TaxID=2841567 RepID=UPI001C090F27|nr:DUF2065 domain-containing protein [Alteromonas sp. C1M14]MBU2978707.1 DUF2065 domain-containing protein [Alteromonas sp. C1M14]